MRYRVLGPLEVTDHDGTTVDVGGAEPRALLTRTHIRDWASDVAVLLQA